MPEAIKIMNKLEKSNLMKPIVFTMFLKGRDIRKLHMFHPKVIKKHVCNPSALFDSPNHIKYKKRSKMDSKQGPKICHKSSKIHPGTLKGLPECISAPLDHQNGTKMVPKDLQMNPKWSFRDPKRRQSQQNQITNSVTNKYYF